jgi:protein SERAC1
MPSQP